MDIEIIIAGCSTIIALSALGASIWQGYIQSRHHKLSALPHLTIDYDHRSSNDVAVYLKSNGLGPAKLIEYEWLFNGKRFPIGTKQDYLDLLNVMGHGGTDVEFYGPHIGGYLEPGFNCFLIRFSNSADTENHKNITCRLYKAGIYLKYESIYGEVRSETHMAENV